MKIKPFDKIPYLQGKRLTIRKLGAADADGVREFTENETVYRYLPTFLYERKYPDVMRVINGLYDECLKDSLILGVFEEDSFCGLAEMYGFTDRIHKISVGYRFMERCWGRGIATETLKLLVDYLYSETDIEIITASTMLENQASARVLKKNGFEMVVHAAPEDWGFNEPTLADKWIR